MGVYNVRWVVIFVFWFNVRVVVVGNSGIVFSVCGYVEEVY